MREVLIEELIKEILGPRNGPEEEMHWNPYKEYLTGVIEPVRCKKKKVPDPDSEDITLYGENFVSEDDVGEEVAPVIAPTELDPKTKPKSFGISFLIRGSKPELSICVTWGRYKKIQREDRITWKRFPYKVIVSFRLERDFMSFPIYQGEDGKILLYVRRVPLDYDHQNVVITLVNDLEPENCFEERITEACIFQPSIRVKLLGDARLAQPEIGDDLMLFLYRNRPVLARGYMCSAIWKDVDYQEYFEKKVLWPDGVYFEDCAEFFDCDVRSDFVPLYPSSAPNFEWDEEMRREFGDPPELFAYRLSEMWDEDEIERFLGPVVDAYRRWIQKNESRISSEPLPENLKQLGFQLIENQKELLRRIKNGIELLKSDEEARFAFCFANRVIWIQHKWKGRGEFRWWPFQLAFILMVLESLANPASRDREKTDLLWIATGGGKTEAYLALMAFIMALRRVRARRGKASESTGGGTAVITRYTLRLLTIQQFRRILRMVTAAEFLRVMRTEKGRGWRPEKCEMSEDFILGSTRFSAGLWVGGAVTPNHLRKKGYAIDALMGKDAEGEPAQVIRCPVCGTYLSVPSSGLPEGEKLYLLIRSGKTEEEIKSSILSFIETSGLIRNFRIFHHGGEFFTLEIELDKKMTENEVDNLWQDLKGQIAAELLSFRASRPGYFGCRSEVGRKSNIPRDFEIYCPNPHCTLNTEVEYVEGVPLNPDGNGEILPDGLVTKEHEHPFSGSRMPIPALTVDEQIYYRCPTIIVSTADKIARMAFEPRAASIYGNVEKYNAYYGYYRKNLLPETTTKSAADESNSIDVSPFSPPELIVQDELHLIEGPLGSMFGLYETVVEGLQNISGVKPKYIASTATIKDAELQVRQLFARNLFQFPAYGIDIEDSFFVRYPSWDAGWDENRPGRVYMGVYCPGMGPLTPQIRIWARLLKTCYDHRDDPAIKYFWTIVGYFNAIRELGGGRALYREDTVERLKQISLDRMRPVDPENVVELSSRISSTEIPVILDELEEGERRDPSENPDAIFTTSMFGTGVDVPHLSLMIVNGQPKTTSQYVQATGRVGRAHGALVITFLRAGRPRDLSHYEMFTGYHHRIHLEVEPSSVSPFSKGCLARASGPVLVSFLRNLPNPKVVWFDEYGGKEILNPVAEDDIKKFTDITLSRISRIITDNGTINELINYFRSQVDRWKYVAAKIRDVLKFMEYCLYRLPEFSVVLGDPLHEKSPSVEVVYRNAPQSLREIEETTGFEV
ncbi:hypothetical protein Asulf_01355 [Archaeoglobus sulfaticallidus PM70-1]|uniref:Helicase C-terminal domain-containing protein n=1 Tax=Archaeoglobus sulfaticallidus PM70-1 TaxID=387631 RepID=N0BLC6_9EURY|nr:DISARM system helicase DrmA [Archaeoglobus sulfaticallidus]AGK61346.1 hypothetical protein Asulf_01355 [Archaeoglobus sulfaticallidus PM70-1]